MALNQAQLMAVPGGPGVVGAVQAGTGISISNGVISAITYSGPNPPSGPQIGQLWYDTVNDVLKVWDGSAWVPVAGNSVVTKLIAGSNIALSPTSGVGDVTISVTPGGSIGTVSSVTVSGTNGITTTGSPITGSGTITVNFPVQSLPPLP